MSRITRFRVKYDRSKVCYCNHFDKYHVCGKTEPGQIERKISGIERMGNQAGKEKSEIETVSREASDLVTQYRNLKGNHKSLSVKKLRQSELSMLSDGDDRKSHDIEEKIKHMFANEKEIDFRGYLKWEITKGGSTEELAKKLESLFNIIDDGDGTLTPEELVNLEASLDVTLTVDQAEVIIRDYDTNGDGRMNLDELIFYHTSTHRT